MTIRVRFFASIREAVGQSDVSVTPEGGLTARQIWAKSTGLPVPANLLVAINQEYAALDTVVRDGDEVAYFPPVTGG